MDSRRELTLIFLLELPQSATLLAPTKQNPISKYRLSHFSLPFSQWALFYGSLMRQGTAWCHSVQDPPVPPSQAPHECCDPTLLPGKNATVLTDQAQTQDNETLPGAKPVHHFGKVPWQPSVAQPPAEWDLSCRRQDLPAASSSSFPGTADMLG